MHLGEAVGSGSNISDAQIHSAIQGLNDWFANVHGFGLDVEIQFCLAVQGPDGCPTTGINRVDASGVSGYQAGGINNSSCSAGASENDIKSLSRWSVADYYNIWTVNWICNGAIAGYAYYPNGSANDGTVIQSSSMSYWSTILAHELGHGFNLPHTFNNYDPGCPTETDCTTQGDRSCDTPPHRSTDCGTSDPCGGGGVWENSRWNIMSYCGGLNRFTSDQKTRMRATLLSGVRSWLLNSTACQPSDIRTSVTKTDASCYGVCDGTVTVTPTCDGTYTYLWSNGETSPVINGLCQGNYSVTIIDSVGRETGLSVEITQPDPVVANIVSSTNISCSGDSVDALVNVVGGTPYSPCVVPQVAEIGTGTYVNGLSQNPGVYASYWMSSKLQMLIKANELQALNIGPGQLMSAAFNVASINGISQFNEFELQMGHTNVPWLTDFQTGLQEVFEAQTVNIGVGWNEHLFTTPFVWDGTSNVVLQICFKNSVREQNAPTFGTNTSYTSVLVFNGGSPGACSFTYVSASSPYRPNIRFQSCPDTSVYSFLWNDGQTTATATGLTSGQYSVHVTDAHGCTDSAEVVITEPTGPPDAATTVISQQPNCSNLTGTMEVSAPLGDYEYQVDGGTYQSTTTFSGLSVGSHTIRVRNSTYNTCVSAISTVVISAAPLPAAPTVNITSQPTCSNTNGTGAIEIVSHLIGFEYAIDGGVFQSSPEFTGLISGTYDVQVRDVSDTACLSSPTNISISNPSQPSIPTTSTYQATCSLPSGRLVVNSPTGSFEYSLDGGLFQESTLFDGIPAGSFTVVARSTDDTTCVSPTASVTFYDPIGTPADATVNITQATCGTPTGTIEVAAPLGNYDYRVDGGQYQSSTTFSGVTTGGHTLFVRSTIDQTCMSTIQVNVYSLFPVSSPAVVNIMTQPSCAEPTGAIEVTYPVSGYKYAIDEGYFQLGTTFTGLQPGVHEVFVTRIPDTTCISTATLVTITEPLQPSFPTVFNLIQPSCALNSGTITFSSQAGVEYSIGSGYQADETFSGLNPGAYTLTARSTSDASCVTDAVSAITLNPSLGEPDAPTVLVTSQPTCGVSAGTIEVTYPVGQYEYSIDAGSYQLSTTFTNVATGSHSVVVRRTDDNTCVSQVTSVTIDSPQTEPTSAILSTIQPTCALPTATVDVTSPLGAYEYAIEGGSYQVSASFAGITDGAYNILVRSSTDTTCVSTVTLITIAEPLPPSVPTVSNIIQPTCATVSGAIHFTPQVGVEYSVGSGFQSDEAFSALTPGSYTLTVRITDDATCTTDAVSAVVINADLGVPDAPTAIATSQPSCGIPTGTIEITVPLGSYEYSLDAGAYQSSTTFSNVSIGSHDILTRRIDDNSCISTNTSFTLNGDIGLPTSAILSTTEPTCANPTANVAVTSPLGAYEYSIDGSTYQASTSFTGVEDGVYNILVRNSVDPTCISSPTQVTIIEPSPPSEPTVASIIQPTCSINTGTIVFSSQSDVEYSIGSGFQVDETFSVLTPGSYTLTVRSTDDVTCTTEAISTVTINADLGGPVAPTVSITSSPTCTLSTGSIEVTAPLGSYEYSLDAAAYQSSTIFANVAPGSHDILVRRTADNSCISSATSVAIDLPPSAPVAPAVGTIAHPTCVLETGSVVLNNLPATGIWTVNPGGLTGTGITTTISGLAAGTYSYAVTNEDECISAISADIVINNQPIPPSAPTAPVASGGTTACTPDSVNLFSSGSGIFDWQIDGIAQSVASSCFTASEFGTHNYTSTLTGNGCTSDPSPAISVTIFSQNITSMTPNGPTAFCEGENITLIASAGASYYWYPSGTTSSFLNSDTSGTYTLTTVDGNGCEGTATQTITVFSNPASPTILWSTPDLVCSPMASGYQWYLNGVELEDDTLQTFTPFTNGDYSVNITDLNGCISSQSVSYQITLVGVSSSQTDDFSIYPNPSLGLFYINIEGPFEYRVYDKLGNLVIGETSKGNTTIDLTSQATGLYILQLLIDNDLVNHKLLKR
jgi:hypothetical protein